MTNEIQLNIVKTGKSYSPKDKFSIFDRETKRFTTLEDVRTFLKEQYGKCKRVKMYRDIDGKATHCGYIFCFRNDDISHVPVQKWIQQDWVEFETVAPLLIS